MIAICLGFFLVTYQRNIIQPKYRVNTGKIVGGEALVRWIHPKKGMISPGEFIGVFERNGFIKRLDYYVWEEAAYETMLQQE